MRLKALPSVAGLQFMAGLVVVLAMLVAPRSGWAARGPISAPLHTNPLNLDPMVKDAFERFYLLDYPAAVARFEHVHELHPGDPQATALLLNAVIFQELYRQDLLDTTFYANDGFLSGKHATQEDPRVRDHVFALSDEAVHQADARIEKNPNDIDALYARGWAKALRVAYMAMVERAYRAGFKGAMQARDDHEKVLQLDPNYADAKLVVGVYEYVVGALPFPFRIMIGFAGITGSKSKGLALLHDAGDHGTVTTVEARTVIALFLRRESRYQEAIQVIRALRAQYPRDFLFCLEEANLRKDDGEGMAAVDAYRELLANAEKPGYFASARLELAYFGLGDALRGQRLYKEAAEAYEKAAFTEGVSPELKIRTLLGAGQCRDLINDRQTALRNYQMAIDAGPNTSRADIARRGLKSPYRGN